MSAENQQKDAEETAKFIKTHTPIKELCKGLPIMFQEYIQYCRDLDFTQKPDYAYLKGLFDSYFMEQHYELDYIFDWQIMKQNRIEQKEAAEQ